MILRVGSWMMIGLLTLPPAAVATQFCVTESQIPTSTPTNRFSDQGNGTVLDNQTGLMWAECPLGWSGADCAVGVLQYVNWDNALQLAESSEVAGHTDWRLPNIKELDSIVELRCGNPAVNLAVFPNTPNTNFWSSSPSTSNSSNAWTVQFITGDSQGSYGRHELAAIRLVRDDS